MRHYYNVDNIMWQAAMSELGVKIPDSQGLATSILINVNSF